MIDTTLEEEIKKYLTDTSGNIIAARAVPSVLEKRGYLEYLKQRYDDNSTDSFSEVLYRFVHGIDKIPVCPECGGLIRFSISNREYPHWCSPKCRNNSDEVKQKNKKNVSRALKDAYSERKADICSKRAKTLTSRYGYDNMTGSPFSCDSIRKKVKETVMDKYGVPNVFYLETYRNSDKMKSRMREQSIELWKPRGLDIEYTDNNTIIIHNGCEKHGDIELSISDFNNRTKEERIRDSILCPLCHPINYYSGEEDVLKKFLDENHISYTSNDRTVISPYELDFYIKDKNLAIEMNGVYYHSVEGGKDKNYHKMKTMMCADKGIQLIHIWEDEWNTKRDIVISMLKSKLGLLDNRIYARKCEIKPVSSVDSEKFCEDNHLQGYVHSKYKFGLYYNGELVSLMTFGKCRPILNAGRDNKTCELYRFCNKLGTTVIGGASKLFKYAECILKREGYDKIYTFAQRDWSDGNLYKKLGFRFIGGTEPNYFYCNVGKERLSRYMCMKHKLIEKFGDNGLTENEMMKLRGYYRCYDSGNLKYEKEL